MISTLHPTSFKRYANVTGAVLDAKNGLYTVSEAQYQKIQPLSLVINGSTFTLTRDAVRIQSHSKFNLLIKSLTVSKYSLDR